MACVCPCLAIAGCCIGCLGWCIHRAELTGREQSLNWPPAKVEDVIDFSRTCLLVMAVQEEDLANPSAAFPEEGRALLQRLDVRKRVGYKEAEGRFPPYMITIDHRRRDVTVAVRAMNWQKLDDFMTVLDNRKGGQKFNGGYAHNGMLRSAGYLLDEEMDNLNALMLEYKEYTLTLAGHSLGSGVVCLMTLILLQNLGELKGITRNRIRCHCFAPARCVSLNIAVSSADVINSIVLQDDFLPRMNYPLETIFAFWLCLPCVLQWACCVDFFLPQEKLIKDPRRLYPPGRLFHLLYTGGGKCNVIELEPEARVDIPVDGRFEKLIISQTTHADHLLTSIYAQLKSLMKAMQDEEEDFMAAPKEEKMTRMKTCQKAKMESLVGALERAQTLLVPNAFDPSSARLEEEELMTSKVLGPELTEGSLGEATPAPVSSDRIKSERGSSSKWSKIIDEIIAKESSKQPSGSVPERKWSFVRKAVKEQKVKRTGSSGPPSNSDKETVDTQERGAEVEEIQAPSP